MAIGDYLKTYLGDGVTTDFPIPFPYDDATTEVIVTRQGGAVTYSFLTSSLIRLTSPTVIAVGDSLTISRYTNIDNPKVVYKNGSTSTGGQLNSMVTQLLRAIQEIKDIALSPLRLVNNVWDATFKKIVNLGAPTLPNDAVRLTDLQAATIAAGNVPLPTVGQIGYRLKATATNVFGWVYNGEVPLPIAGQTGYAIRATGIGADQWAWQNYRNIKTDPSFSDTFVGSGTSAQLWQNVNVAASSNTAAEIGAQFGINSNTGLANTTTAYKIGLTSSALGGTGSASVYAFNSIVQGYGGTYLVTGIESDVNNIGADALSLGGSTAVYGYVGVAAGTKKSTAGLWLTKSGVNAGWQLGVAVSDAASASFFENATSATGLNISGVHSSAGIDFTGMTGTATCIIAPNNRAILSQADSGAVQRAILYIDNTNLLQFGNPNVSYINVNQSLVPNSDNAYQVGKTGNRWTSVWAVNGTIQTSDPRLKTEIQPLPAGLSIVESIEPKTFKWKDGGSVMVDTQVEEDWHVHVEEEREVISTAIINGKAIQTKRKVRELVPVYDEVPVVDENGKPVMAKSSKGVKPVQATHRIARMGKRTVTKKVAQSKPGQRTHWGFMASDIKTGFAPHGDFGGYILDEDGTEHLRPDQLIPVLWKAVQELSAKVAKLEGRG